LLFYSNPPTTYYYYWPYYLFILVGTFISLYLVREKDFGRGPETNISVENVLPQKERTSLLSDVRYSIC